jgi:hypothetical protein
VAVVVDNSNVGASRPIDEVTRRATHVGDFQVPTEVYAVKARRAQGLAIGLASFEELARPAT